jgi:hypothetical protein
MVKSGSGKAGMRSFTVVGVAKHGGCKTKFNSGRYISRNAAGAAKKAFNEHCRVKRIRGRCVLRVTVKETTQGSNGKEYTYKLLRKKLSVPLVRLEGTPNQFVVEYMVVAKSTNTPPPCKASNNVRSAGKMSKKTSRKSKAKVNNVLRKKNNNSKKNKSLLGRFFN